MLGICNGFQVLCEAHLLPGALLPNTSLRFVCRQVDVVVEHDRTAFTRACEPGDVAVAPGQAHDRAAGSRRRISSTSSRRNGQLVLRYAPGHNPNGSTRDIAGVVQRGRQRARPDAAPRARDRRARPAPTDGLRLFTALSPRRGVSVTDRGHARRLFAEARALGPHRRRDAAHRRAARPRAERGRAGRLLAAVVRALRLQALEEAAAQAPDRGRAGADGPGRERRRDRRGRRPRGRVQGREPQPPLRRRAVPGSGHRSRRHPARHLRARRAAGRGARLAALRRPRHAAHALPARARGGRHRRLRQLGRRADRRRRGRTSSRPTSRTAS